jgi:hypothetical protein
MDDAPTKEIVQILMAGLKTKQLKGIMSKEMSK